MTRRCDAIDRFVRFLSFPESGCWEWTGGTTLGYGSFYDGEGHNYAHRFLYEYLIGDVPDGMELDHLCRNRRCVNPDHLEPVTHRENVMRSPIAPAALNARKTHCPRGHALVARPGTSHRFCRECNRESMRRRYQRMKHMQRQEVA